MLELAGQSHTGRVREHNEDAIWYDADGGVAILADGVGGHNAGEVASRLTVETFAAHLADARVNERCIAETKKIMIDSLLSANEVVRTAASASPEKYRMATTAVALCVVGKIYGIANVGDSRAYLLRRSGIHQITKDHTYVQGLVDSGEISETEAQQHPARNILTRCIGTDTKVQVDFFHGCFSPCEPLMLCSDGVYDLLEEREIIEITNSRRSADDACSEIIERAIKAGGYDNASVVMAKRV